MGHGMVTDGSVGSGSSVIDFTVAWLGSKTFLACCGIPLVVHLCLDWVCRCDLGIILDKKGVLKRV